MQALLDFVLEYKIEMALPLVVAILVNALKAAFGNFFSKNKIGFRLKYFLPLIIGLPLGLCLTKYPMAERLMIGAALGGMSHFLYKLIMIGY